MAVLALALLSSPAPAAAKDQYSEALVMRRVGRGGSRVYAQVRDRLTNAGDEGLRIVARGGSAEWNE